MSRKEQDSGLAHSEMISIAGRIALVTGSSRDFGAGIAKELAKEGAIVIGSYRNKARRSEEVRKDIEENGGKVSFVQADIKSALDREKLVKAAIEAGGLDFLVLNAAGADRELNVDGNNALVDELLPFMRSGGRIIFIQSSPGHFYDQLPEGTIPRDYISVASSKHDAEISLNERINEFNERDIRFNVIVFPEIVGTLNMEIFRRRDPMFTTRLEEIAEGYGHTRLKLSIEEGAREVFKVLSSPNQESSTIVI